MLNPQKSVIVFNGPPESGKDQACDYIARYIKQSKHLMFKRKLFELVLDIFNISKEEYFALYNNRETKETPTCQLRGFSPREAMIFVSETVIKPNFGKDFFGVTAAEDMVPGLNVFSDGGFPEELEPVYTECEGNMMIVRVHRPGYEWGSDSRSYVNEFKDVPIMDLHNDSSLDVFKTRVFQVVYDFGKLVNKGDSE